MHDYRESGNPPRALADPAAAYNPADNAAYTLTAPRIVPASARIESEGASPPPDGDDYTYDLRTLPERERADVAALALRCDSLQEQVSILSRRLDSLDAWRGAVDIAIDRHADWMQLRELRGEDGK